MSPITKIVIVIDWTGSRGCISIRGVGSLTFKQRRSLIVAPMPHLALALFGSVFLMSCVDNASSMDYIRKLYCL